MPGSAVAVGLIRAIDSLVRQRYDDLDELDDRRTDRHDPDGREDAEYERKDHLDAGLGGGLFRALPALGAERLRVHAQRLRHAHAELIGLYEHRHQRDHVLDASTLAQIAQRFGPRLAGTQLQVDEPELIRKIGMRERELVAHPLNRGVETEALFDAHDEQVE